MIKMRKHLHSLLLLSIFVVLNSCVPNPADKTGSGKVSLGGGVTQIPSSVNFFSGTPTVSARQDLDYSWTPTTLATGIVYSATGLPSWVSIDSSTGELSGTPNAYGNTNNIRIRASKNSTFTEHGPFSIQVTGDPLKEHAWHLGNSAQSAFSLSVGVIGKDINQIDTINDSNLGTEVRVAVSDSGLDIDHPDLATNVLTPLSKDYNLSAPYYGDPGVVISGDHGTSVAGIIAAIGWNNIGSRGVAPEAKIIGLNYTSSPQTSAIQLDQAQDDHDIYNYSYGTNFYPMALNADSSYNDQVKYGVDSQRGNLGSVYIKSSGNSFSECDFSSATFYLGLFCFSHNSNLGAENELPWMISVGATNALGVKASYSSHGANLWVSAPGGEDGLNDPAIITTDVVGCSAGYSRFGVTGNSFQTGSSDNSNCDYTQEFNGTSAAAPIISGAVAVLLEVNPGLTWRDIKHILASTSSKVDSASSDQIVDASFDFDNGIYVNLFNSSMNGHVYSQGWTTNSAGYSFHNFYGFGQVDIDAAVAMAKTYSANSWGSLNQSDSNFTSSISNVNTAIPDNNVSGLSDIINVTDSYTIESVQIRINITHPRPGDLGIELTSPSGTKSILMNINNSLLIGLDGTNPDWVDDYTNAIFLSNAFYGESSTGNWTIRVIDGLGASTGNTGLDSAATQDGALVNWSINVIGR